MAKPVLIKDKKQEVFDKAQSTKKGRELLSTLEEAKSSYEVYLKLCDKIRELAIEANFSIEETNLLALIVLEKANFSVWYRKKAIMILNPPTKMPDYAKLANRAIFNSPMKAITDKQMYEGDFDFPLKFIVVSKKDLIKAIKESEDEIYIRVRDGRFNNVRSQMDANWINPEEWEIAVDSERRQLEAQIN